MSVDVMTVRFMDTDTLTLFISYVERDLNDNSISEDLSRGLMLLNSDPFRAWGRPRLVFHFQLSVKSVTARRLYHVDSDTPINIQLSTPLLLTLPVPCILPLHSS